MGKAERTRQFIIEKAAPIINRKGMAGTSLSDIMEATGLAKGCLYGNFENKDEICEEAFVFLIKKSAAELQHSLKNIVSAKRRLFAFLDLYREGRFRDENGGCPVLNFGAEADDTNPQIRDRVREAIHSSQSHIREMIVGGIESDEFIPGIDAVSLSVKFFAMLEGAVLISRIQGNNESMNTVVNQIKTEINSFCL